MSEELIYKVGVEGTNELNKLEQKVTDTGKATNKTTDYFQKMRMELRAARGDMLKYAEGTQEYNKALNKAADIQGRMKDVNDKVRASTQDLGDTTKNITGAMVGFAGGFQVVQSAMSLFGIENEETIKTILKLQQTMAIVQGMSAFANSIDNAQDLIAGFRASNQQLTDELKTTSDGMEGVSKSSDKMGESLGSNAKQSAVLGSNLAGNTALGDKLTKSIKEMNEARQNSIANAEAELLEEAKHNKVLGEKYNRLQEETALLVEKSKVLEDSGNLDAIAMQRLDEELSLIEKKTNALVEEIGAGKDREKGLKEHIKSMKEANEAEEMAVKAKEKNKTATEKLTESTKKAGKGISAFGKSILKSLGTMAVFLAAIWAVTSAVSWMIKKLSEVPEDIKIKLELNTSALNSYISTLTKIRNYVRDYNQAIKDGNKNHLKQLDKIATKEYQKNQADMDAIKERGKMTLKFFDSYLQTAKDTYFNEALAKLKSEKEVALLIAKEEEKSAQKLKDQRKEENKGESGFITLGRWIFTKDQVKKARKEGEKVQKELDVLSKINYKEVKSPFIEDPDVITPPSSRVASGKAPSLIDKKPDAVEDDLEVEYLKRRNALIKELTNEEIVIRDEALRKSDVLQSDSEVKYTEYQIRLGQARATDLENQKGYIEESIEKAEQYYKEELSLNNKNLEEATVAHNEELDKLRDFNQIKFDIEERHSALAEERMGLDGEKDAERIKAIDAEIEANKRLYAQNNDNIAQSKELVAKHKQEISDIEEKLNLLDNTPEEIARLEEELQKLNLAIADNSAFLVDSLARNTQAMLEQATFYVDTMAQTFNGLENMTADFMQAEDNKLAKEKNNLEASQAYREADSEQQQQMMYELEMANYEAKKKTFETNKAFQIGGVVATSAANQMDIIKAWLDPKTGGPLSPANIAVAAAGTLANVTTTIGSIKQIASTSLEKPVPPMPQSGGMGAIGNVALSPNKTALTSKEENLNSMYQSGKGEMPENVVKVSEINNVQRKVSVRERNSSY